MHKTVVNLIGCGFLSISALGIAQSNVPTKTSVTAEGLFGDLYTPANLKGKAPAILALGGSEGGLSEGVGRESKQLAELGYIVLQLAYFDAPGRPKILESLPLEYFKTGIDWLRSQPNVDPARIGIIGGSKGGEAALLLASQYRELKVVVATVPANVVWPGIRAQHNGSSWTLNGKDLPALPYGMDGGFTSVFALYEKGLQKIGEHPETVIPVERINGPVLLICGKQDALWPSCPMSEMVVARLKSKSFKHEVKLLAYDDAGHASSGMPVPEDSEAYKAIGSMGGSSAGNNAARKDGWPKTVAFFDGVLRAKGK